MFNNKKAMDLSSYWVELLFFSLLVAGFIIRMSMRGFVTSVLLIMICALIAGRILYEKRRTRRATYIIIIIGLLMGMLLGRSILEMAVIIMIFLLGLKGSYYLHQQGYI